MTDNSGPFSDYPLPYQSYDDMADVFRQYVSPGKLDLWEGFGFKLVLGKRNGITFTDAYSGKEYINCHVNGGCYNLGHNNPRVVQAVQEALGKLDIANHHFGSPLRAQLGERLSATTGHALSRVVYGVSGGEAIDVAIKAARAHTGRQKIVSAQGGYHGHTGLSLAAGDPEYRELYHATLPDFVQVPWDDPEAMAQAVDSNTAAVLLEGIPATMGMCPPSEGYFQAVRQACDAVGAAFIVDEVQSGLGRTGKIWSYQHDGIVPDILVTGKGLSGGIYPITATLMTPEIHEILSRNPTSHISTFGGAELGCVAALAVLDIIEEPGFLKRVTELGERFEEELHNLPFRLRRRGMFMGLEFEEESQAFLTLLRLFEAGVFPFPSGNDRRVLQFLPPLTITDDEASDLIGRVQQVCTE